MTDHELDPELLREMLKDLHSWPAVEAALHDLRNAVNLLEGPKEPGSKKRELGVRDAELSGRWIRETLAAPPIARLAAVDPAVRDAGADVQTWADMVIDPQLVAGRYTYEATHGLTWEEARSRLSEAVNKLRDTVLRHKPTST